MSNDKNAVIDQAIKWLREQRKKKINIVTIRVDYDTAPIFTGPFVQYKHTGACTLTVRIMP